MNASEPSPANLLDRRYRLLQVVAHGRLGRVYRARHVGLDAIVALKELRPPARIAGDAREAARNRFFREARALTALSHPNLPRVHDYFSHGHACFLVMDYIEGEPLAARARRQERLPSDEVLRFGVQLSDALAYLHRQRPPLYLGTLSLSDVIITREGRAMLADFGVAHRFARAIQDGDQAHVGAPQSDAGETLASAEGDIRADVLSLGTVLRELLVGDDPAVDLRHLTSSHELGLRTSSKLDAIIATTLGLDPTRQFATVEEMGHALRAAAHQLMPAPRAAPSTAGPLAGDNAQPPPPAALPFAPEPLLEYALVAAPQPGAGADGVFAGDGVYRASGDTRPRWPDRMVPPATPRRRKRTIGTLAMSALALAAVTALALTLSLSAGLGATVTAGSGSAMGVSATHVAPPPAPQRAASQLGGPPSNANPPDEQFIRSSPPTPTPLPTATARPTSGPTPFPTAPSSPCVTPTTPPYLSGTPDASPTATPEPSPPPDATPTDGPGTGATSQPTRDADGTTGHVTSAASPASATPPPGSYTPCASDAGATSPMPGVDGAVAAPALDLSAAASPPPSALVLPPGWPAFLAMSWPA